MQPARASTSGIRTIERMVMDQVWVGSVAAIRGSADRMKMVAIRRATYLFCNGSR